MTYRHATEQMRQAQRAGRRAAQSGVSALQATMSARVWGCGASAYERAYRAEARVRPVVVDLDTQRRRIGERMAAEIHGTYVGYQDGFGRVRGCWMLNTRDNTTIAARSIRGAIERAAESAAQFAA